MKFLLVILVYFNSLLCSAQLKLFNKNLLNPDSNILFLLDNYLELSDTSNFSAVKIASSNSNVYRIGKSFCIHPKSLANDTIKVYRNNRLVLSKSYTIQKSNDYKVQLAFINDTIMSVNSILSNPLLSLKYIDGIQKMDFQIESYKCILEIKGEQNIKFGEIGGAYLTQDLLSFIKKMKAGDKIIFNDITAGCPNSRRRLLSQFRVTIK